MSTPVQHTAVGTRLWFRFISTVPVSLVQFLRRIYATANIQFQVSPTIQKTRTHISDLTYCHLLSTNFTECLLSRSVLASIDIQMIQLSFLVSSLFQARATHHLQVLFALYFPIPTNQAQAYRSFRDMYSCDGNQFRFLPATLHFVADLDFSCSHQPLYGFSFLNSTSDRT